jgi:hypothetical protein
MPLLGREPINSEALPNVRFGAHSGLKSDIAPSPRSADSVAKVPDEGPISNNRIGTSGFPNQHCALASDLESMLLAHALKIVLQHYLPLADSCTAANAVPGL